MRDAVRIPGQRRRGARWAAGIFFAAFLAGMVVVVGHALTEPPPEVLRCRCTPGNAEPSPSGHLIKASVHDGHRQLWLVCEVER